MGANPCCMPLKVGVKIITHLSMALAIAVGVMGIRLISISLEVTTNPTFQQHLNTLQLQNENEILWKSDPMMKGSFRGLIYPEDDPDGLSTFSQNHHLHSTSRNFMLEYSKVTLVSGLMALCAAVFQFLCSCLLLCFINLEGKAATQIWVAVNCSILFCFATCLALFVCEGISVPVYSMDEKLFLILLTADTLLSIYFLWIVMAFI